MDMKKEEKKKNISKGKIFLRYISFCLVLISVLAFGLIYFIGVIPNELFWALLVTTSIVDLILIAMMLANGVVKNIVGFIFSILIIVGMVLAINYELNTLDFFKLFGINNYNTENYSVWVLKNSNYNNIDDLKNQSIGSLKNKSDGLKKAEEQLQKKVSLSVKDFDNVDKLMDNVDSKNVDAMILEQAQIDLLTEQSNDAMDNYKKIYDFSVNVNVEKNTKSVDVTKDSFNILVSGIDTYGSINNVSRSDVNLIITVNPNTNEILLTSIPRDYYVTLDKFNQKDKLTHAGIYGIDCSVNTIENLLNVDLNYYYKVNFTSLISIVDELGGIEVYSDTAFTTIDGNHFIKGMNKLDGKKALAFSRERKSFVAGDRKRIQNQQVVLEAIIKKSMTPNIITKYNSLLNDMKGKFITNMDTKSLTGFIKSQMNESDSWNIKSNSLDGENAYMTTYSYPKTKLYVMIPNEDTVTKATDLIKSTLKK
jgi:LCP family protein required for cell wall assembly